MKHYTTKVVPEHTENRLDSVTCDFCGKKIEFEPYKLDDVTIDRNVGDRFPEGSRGVKESVDMCGECWETKLIPWIKAQGVTPTVKEWEW